jgi:hypothetical protein
VLVATLKGPRLAPSTRLINDLDDHGSNGVSGQQPDPIFRPERASPQGIPRLIRMRSVGFSGSDPPACPGSGPPRPWAQPKSPLADLPPLADIAFLPGPAGTVGAGLDSTLARPRISQRSSGAGMLALESEHK